jgi:integrase
MTVNDLSACVPKIANWRLSDLPKFLEPEHVERLLEACRQDTPIGRRDYAILLLLARLGLRAGEVVHLELDDIDWERGEIRARRVSDKTGFPFPRMWERPWRGICSRTGLAVRRGGYSFA